MTKVLVSDKIADAGIEILKNAGFEVAEKTELSEDELLKEVKDSDALIVRSGTKVTKNVIDAMQQMKVIGRAGTGLDNVDVEAAKAGGIEVMNTPCANSISAAEHTVAMMLSLCRHIHHAHISLEAGKWERSKFKGTELTGKTIGIIGLGNVGQNVAKMLKGFDVKILAHDPFAADEKFGEVNAEKTDLDNLVKNSDFITVHVKLTSETRNLLGEKQFAEAKDSVNIINTARGGVIDEKALYKALKSGKVAGAALDVFEKEPPEFREILNLENVVSTPHIGALTKEAQMRCGIQIAEKVVEKLKK